MTPAPDYVPEPGHPLDGVQLAALNAYTEKVAAERAQAEEATGTATAPPPTEEVTCAPTWADTDLTVRVHLRFRGLVPGEQVYLEAFRIEALTFECTANGMHAAAPGEFLVNVGEHQFVLRADDPMVEKVLLPALRHKHG